MCAIISNESQTTDFKDNLTHPLSTHTDLKIIYSPYRRRGSFGKPLLKTVTGEIVWKLPASPIEILAGFSLEFKSKSARAETQFTAGNPFQGDVSVPGWNFTNKGQTTTGFYEEFVNSAGAISCKRFLLKYLTFIRCNYRLFHLVVCNNFFELIVNRKNAGEGFCFELLNFFSAW